MAMAMPIMRQPGAPVPPGTWMNAPMAAVPDCPPGLEYLTQVDQLVCHQVVEVLQAFTGWETNNKYAIKNSMGQQIYYAFEETNCCMRLCCKTRREFTLHIVDNCNKEVMRVFRPFKCCAGNSWCAGCCNCCSQEITIEAPPGFVVGSVHQTGACCTKNFDIRDFNGNTQLKIDGPCFALWCKCCCDIDFKVLSKDGKTQVGKITKQWSGLGKELFTVADNFSITFPMDLDVKMKATMLGALFLIDLMLFEGDDE